MKTCKFNRAWIGPCGKSVAKNSSDRCAEHVSKKCFVPQCDNKATRECDGELS